VGSVFDDISCYVIGFSRSFEGVTLVDEIFVIVEVGPKSSVRSLISWAAAFASSRNDSGFLATLAVRMDWKVEGGSFAMLMSLRDSWSEMASRTASFGGVDRHNSSLGTETCDSLR